MSSIKRDPVFKAAREIEKRMNRRVAISEDRRRFDIDRLRHDQQRVDRALRYITKANQQGWTAAAKQFTPELIYSLRNLKVTADSIMVAISTPETKAVPRLFTNLYDDLRQLSEEFETLDLSDAAKIVVVTEPIELSYDEDRVHLGRFAIEFHLDAFEDCKDIGCFRCVAKDPNPAAKNSEITHPHVENNCLCAGDARIAISTALKGGRICDAFVLINSVLTHYNPGSPFVSLSEWEGVTCRDCGRSNNSDEMYSCNRCGRDYCEDCIQTCNFCGISLCYEHINTDEVSDVNMCDDCARTCSNCDRRVDKDSFVSDVELCPECYDKAEEDLAATEEEEEDDAEEDDAEERQNALNEEARKEATVPLIFQEPAHVDTNESPLPIQTYTNPANFGPSTISVSTAADGEFTSRVGAIFAALGENSRNGISVGNSIYSNQLVSVSDTGEPSITIDTEKIRASGLVQGSDELQGAQLEKAREEARLLADGVAQADVLPPQR